MRYGCKTHTCEPGACAWTPYIGRRLGAAWNGATDALRDGGWHSVRTLIADMCDAADVLPETSQNLLREARQHGVLAVRTARGCSEYRLTPDGRERRPELW